MTDRKLIEDALAELQGSRPFSPLVTRLRERLRQPDWTEPYRFTAEDIKAVCDQTWEKMAA